MAESNPTPNKRKSNAQTGTVPLSDIFFMTLRHWPWIIASVILCVGAAYIHLLRIPNVYTRACEIQIKDEDTNTGLEEFGSLGLMNNNTNIQNEMINLRALDLMTEVVDRLGLDVNYTSPGRFHDVTLYGSDLPVKVDFTNTDNQSAFNFTLTVEPNGTTTISELQASGKKPMAKEFTGKLASPITTPLANIIVTPTPAYKPGEAVTINISKVPLIAAAAGYNSALAISMTNEKATVLKITISDTSSQRADDILNMLINVYNENWIHDKNQIAVSTSNFINERLAVIENELGNVDTDISSFKSATLTPDINAAASLYMGQNHATQAAITEVNTQLTMARYIRNYIISDTSKDQLLPANTGIAPSINTIINGYNDQILQRNAIIAKSSDKHPLIAQIDLQLNAQRQAIIRTIDNEIVALNTQLKSLQSTEDQAIAQLKSSPTQAKNLLSIERQQKVKESLYLFLLQKREENELSQTFTAYNTRIINQPSSGGATTPNRGKFLMMAFLIGLALPFGFTYLRETLNSTLRGRKDIEDLLPPFLGEIPLYAKNREKGKYGRMKFTRAIVVKSGKRDVINEAFRVLRTNLEFVKIHKDQADVIALTSFNPGSGKSFLTMNLGVALALNNQRVLIIDGDMRHGSASTYINSPARGLSEILSGAIANPAEAIVNDKTLGANLQVLPIGTVPPNPSELLKSANFAQLIDNLRPHYDYILIDCPPIEVVADAQIIDKQADRTIFILRAGLLQRNMLPQVDRLYEEAKFNNMAIILNGTTASSNRYGRYGYTHSYRYGYGYGYGYGYDTPTNA